MHGYKVSEIKAMGLPYGVDFTVEAEFGISADCIERNWVYKATVPLHYSNHATIQNRSSGACGPLDRTYKMVIPPVFYDPDGNNSFVWPTKEVFTYTGELSDIIPQAEAELRYQVEGMLKHVVNSAASDDAASR